MREYYSRDELHGCSILGTYKTRPDVATQDYVVMAKHSMQNTGQPVNNYYITVP